MRLVRWLVWLIALGAVGLVAAAVVVPRLAGATPYTVLTGSMAPAYPPGTLVIVRPEGIEDVAIGDVITYQRESGSVSVVTHRVVGIGWTSDGEKVLTTRGDANGVADPDPVRAVQVRGEVWYGVPWVGRVNVMLTPSQHELLGRSAAVALLGYAIALMVLDRRRLARERAATPAPAPAPVDGVVA